MTVAKKNAFDLFLSTNPAMHPIQPTVETACRIWSDWSTAPCNHRMHFGKFQFCGALVSGEKHGEQTEV